MRFIHLADVHLGAVPDRGCPWSSRREEEIWETFRRVIAGIRENPVDLLQATYIGNEVNFIGKVSQVTLPTNLRYFADEAKILRTYFFKASKT